VSNAIVADGLLLRVLVLADVAKHRAASLASASHFQPGCIGIGSCERCAPHAYTRG